MELKIRIWRERKQGLTLDEVAATLRDAEAAGIKGDTVALGRIGWSGQLRRIEFTQETNRHD